jgi:hypothetical protein
MLFEAVSPHLAVDEHITAVVCVLQATSSTPRTYSGGAFDAAVCASNLKWDAESTTRTGGPGFMDRAVIESIRLGQGTGNAGTVGYVGWVKIKTGDGAFEYSWQFDG